MNDFTGMTCDFDLSSEELDIRYFDLIDYGKLDDASWDDMMRCADEDAAYAASLAAAANNELPF